MNTAGALGVLFDLVSGLAKRPDPVQREAGAVMLHDALGLFGFGTAGRPAARSRAGRSRSIRR